MNYDININLTKLLCAKVVELTGNSGARKKCVVIPVENNGISVGKNYAFLNLVAWETKEVNKYGQTHSLKLNKKKEKGEQLPYVGNMKPKGQNLQTRLGGTSASQIATDGGLSF